jgi:DNA polymerase III alpha subunit
VLTLLKDSFAGKVTDEKSKLLIKDSRRETIIKSYSKCKEIFEKNRLYPKFCNFFYEKSLLGFNYSVKLLECFPDDTDLINTEQAAEEPIGTKVNIVGFIKETYTGKSRKGSKYMRIVVEDEYGESTFIMGERGVDSWNFEEKPLPSEGDIVYCTGIKSNDIFFLDTFENFDEKIYLKFGDLNREKRKRENEEAKENA